MSGPESSMSITTHPSGICPETSLRLNEEKKDCVLQIRIPHNHLFEIPIALRLRGFHPYFSAIPTNAGNDIARHNKIHPLPAFWIHQSLLLPCSNVFSPFFAVTNAVDLAETKNLDFDDHEWLRAWSTRSVCDIQNEKGGKQISSNFSEASALLEDAAPSVFHAPPSSSNTRNWKRSHELRVVYHVVTKPPPKELQRCRKDHGMVFITASTFHNDHRLRWSILDVNYHRRTRRSRKRCTNIVELDVRAHSPPVIRQKGVTTRWGAWVGRQSLKEAFNLASPDNTPNLQRDDDVPDSPFRPTECVTRDNTSISGAVAAAVGFGLAFNGWAPDVKSSHHTRNQTSRARAWVHQPGHRGETEPKGKFGACVNRETMDGTGVLVSSNGYISSSGGQRCQWSRINLKKERPLLRGNASYMQRQALRVTGVARLDSLGD
ncbi:hypothetical protein SCHPADRAFT_932636 [Schizopora paradoxa]|uniref:Uncharacterized protein n=1 Tax=Schizopora paradoxa TaxID=27342 RepID=A0A0H2RCC0_9AGAM|nr:hypothetical protein SCHPADRAFT_932636 [Schizopora paradoxa]